MTVSNSTDRTSRAGPLGISVKALQAWGQRLTESLEVVIRNFCEEKLTLSRIVSVMTCLRFLGQKRSALN